MNTHLIYFDIYSQKRNTPLEGGVLKIKILFAMSNTICVF
jgi:hypothetical protein